MTGTSFDDFTEQIAGVILPRDQYRIRARIRSCKLEKAEKKRLHTKVVELVRRSWPGDQFMFAAAQDLEMDAKKRGQTALDEWRQWVGLDKSTLKPTEREQLQSHIHGLQKELRNGQDGTDSNTEQGRAARVESASEDAGR